MNEPPPDATPVHEQPTKLLPAPATASDDADGARAAGVLQGPVAPLDDRLVLLKPVAQGGMGTIVAAFDQDLRRKVAVKIIGQLDPEAIRHGRLENAAQADGERADDHAAAAGGQPAFDGERAPVSDEMLQRFIGEAQVAGQLQHPNIVPVYDIGWTRDRRPYYVMKLVGGRTLQQVIHRPRRQEGLSQGSPLARAGGLRELLAIFRKVCEAVAYAHSKGVIHRDLKPENVMVGRFGEVFVMDWGLAKVKEPGEQSAASDQPPVPDAEVEPPSGEVTLGSNARTSDADGSRPMADGSASQSERVFTIRSVEGAIHTVVGQIAGTPAFMAPEQAGDDPNAVDERSDVFALGGILYAILTGRAPHDVDTEIGSSDAKPRDARAEFEEVMARVRKAAIRPPREVVSQLQNSPVSKRTSDDDRAAPPATQVGSAAVEPSRAKPSPAPREVPSALEAIAMKALQAEPRARYQSVDDLLDDLARYEEGRAVGAHAESLFAHVRRVLHRHRQRFVFATLAIAIALAGFVGALVVHELETAREVERRAARARDFADDAIEHAAHHRYAQAEGAAQLALDEHPTGTTADGRDYDSLLSAIRQQRGEQYDMNLRAARTALQSGDFSTARQALARALTVWPDGADALRMSSDIEREHTAAREREREADRLARMRERLADARARLQVATEQLALIDAALARAFDDTADSDNPIGQYYERARLSAAERAREAELLGELERALLDVSEAEALCVGATELAAVRETEAQIVLTLWRRAERAREATRERLLRARLLALCKIVPGLRDAAFPISTVHLNGALAEGDIAGAHLLVCENEPSSGRLVPYCELYVSPGSAPQFASLDDLVANPRSAPLALWLPLPLHQPLRLRPGSYVLAIARVDDEQLHLPVARVPVAVTEGRTIHVRLEADLLAPPTPGWVRVPGGSALLGGEPTLTGEVAPRAVDVHAFEIMTCEVTLGEYARFLEVMWQDNPARAKFRLPQQGGATLVSFDDETGRIVGPPGEGDAWRDWPVSGITAYDAETYATWMNDELGLTDDDPHRLRLPTADEWEKAARGVDGRRYPWGDTFSPTFALMLHSRPGTPALAPVARARDAWLGDESVYGVFDLAGSVSEWTATEREEWVAGNLIAYRTIKGGSFTFEEAYCRCAFAREIPAYQRAGAIGFRLAR